MGKSILYKLFGLGRIPRKVRPVLEAEGIQIADEGIGGWYITRNFKSPGRRTKYRKQGFSGCLVVTKKRVILYSFGRRQINIAVEDAQMAALYADVTRPGTLSLSFDAADFHDGWQGGIEFRLKTAGAQDFFDLLRALGVQQGVAAAASGSRP